MGDIEILQTETYLSMLGNLAGTKMFRNLWAMQSGCGPIDLLEDGKKPCAVVVSSVLLLFGLVGSKRATVEGLERDLVASGWSWGEEIPRVLGSVLVWEPRLQNGHKNPHVGFYIGNGFAVSNDWKSGVVKTHHVTYGIKKNGEPVRRITMIYTHDFLK